ncbi:hypothetical protein DFJ77DRAFT_515431 [Powellomyces hirtus]|nr:hypothetical protein DFJ77DRAFT_515431 [Powellomyces hirtus]
MNLRLWMDKALQTLTNRHLQINILMAIIIALHERRRITDSLDEELEELSEHQPQQKQGGLFEKTDQYTHLSFPLRQQILFVGALMILGACAVTVFIPSLRFLDVSQHTAELIVLSNNRRYACKVQDELVYRVWQRQEQHKLLMQKTPGVPSTSDYPELSRKTDHLYLAQGLSAFVPRDVRIGRTTRGVPFTRSLVESGLDNLINLDHRLFAGQALHVCESSYSYSNPSIYVIANLEDDLANEIAQVDTVLRATTSKRSQPPINGQNVLLTIALAYFPLFYMLNSL